MLLEHLQTQLDGIAARGQTRVQRVAHTPTAPRQTLSGPDGQAREQLMFCSNDYLGLASHPNIANALAEQQGTEAAQAWAEEELRRQPSLLGLETLLALQQMQVQLRFHFGTEMLTSKV